MAANRLDIIVSAVDRNASSVLGRTGAAVRTLTSDVEKLSVRSEAFNRVGRTQAAVAAGLGAGLTYAASQAMQFEQNLRNVNTITKLNEQGFGKLKTAVLDIAKDPRVTDTPQRLSDALYEIESRGFKGQRGLDALKVAAQGATAGMTDTETAGRVLTSTMMAYGKTTKSDAVDVMDQLFRLAQLAAPTFTDIANDYADAAVAAGQLGVPLNELNAAYATMTNKGHSAALTNIALTRLMTTFMDPNKKLLAVMKEQGYESGMQIIKTKGLAGAVEWLTKATGGNQDEMVQLLGEMRAVRAIMSLTGDGATQFADNLREQADYTGSFSAALEEQAKGPMFRWKVVLKELNTEAIQFGLEAIPPITAALRAATSAIRAFGNLPAPVRGLVVWAGGLAAGIIGIMGAMNLARGTVLRFVADWKLLAGAATEAAVASEAAAVASAVAEGGAGAAGTAGTALTTVAEVAGVGGGGRAWEATKRMLAEQDKARGIGAGERLRRLVGGRRAQALMDDAAAVEHQIENLQTWRESGQGTPGLRGLWNNAWMGGAQARSRTRGLRSAGSRLADRAVGMGVDAERALAKGWKGQWSMPVLEGMGTRIAKGFQAALQSVKNFGLGLAKWIISPTGIVVAAIAGLTFELYKLYGVWKELRSAQAQQKASEKSLADADKAYGVIRDPKTGAIIRVNKGAKPHQAALAAQRAAAQQTQANQLFGALANAGQSGSNAQAGGQYGVDNAALTSARTAAWMDYRRSSGGVAGAQEYLGWVTQQANAEMQAARATGDKDKIAAAQEKAAQDIAQAEIGVREAWQQEQDQGGMGRTAEDNNGAAGRTERVKGWGGGGMAGVVAGANNRQAAQSGGVYGSGPETRITPGEATGHTFAFTIYANTREDVMRVVQEQMDRAFP